MENMKERLTRGVAWVGAARAITNLVGLFSTLLLARLLSPDDFGLVAIATTILAIITSLTELSLASALVQHRDPSDRHFHTAFTLSMIRCAAIAALFFALAHPIAALYADPRLVEIVLVLGVTVIVGGLLNPKMVLLSRKLVFWQDFAVNVVEKLVAFVIAIFIAYTYQSYWALILGSAVGRVVVVALSYFIVPYLPRFSLAHLRELFSFSVWLSLGQAVNTLNWKFDHLLIGYVLGKTQLGFYTFGDNLAGLPTREATAPVEQTLFPGFARLASDRARLKQAYVLAQSTLCAMALPIGFGFATIAHPLVLLTVGVKWLPAVIIIQVLAGTIAMQSLSRTLQPLAMAMGETRVVFNRDLIGFAIRVPGLVIGMIAGGLVGIIYARAITSMIGTVIGMDLVKRLIGVSIIDQFRANLRALISTAVMTCLVVLVGSIYGDVQATVELLKQIGLMVATGVLSYAGSSYLLWRLAGRPLGPESEVIRILSAVRRLAFVGR
jgi:O-antigen/teichoic acid export membrane protein